MITEIKANEPININAEVYENGDRITTIDEIAKENYLEVELSEEINANIKPIFVTSSGFNNNLMTCKKVSLLTDKIVGVVKGQRNLSGKKIKILTRGIITDNTLSGVTLNQDIYCNTLGELVSGSGEFRIGKVVKINPTVVYVNCLEEESASTSFLNIPQLDNAYSSVEVAARKVSFFSNKMFKKYSIGLSNIVGIAYGNGTYIAISGTTAQQCIATSPDGINWTLRSLPFVPTDLSLKAIAFGNNSFVICGTATGLDTVLASQDNGATWYGLGGFGGAYDVFYNPANQYFITGGISIDSNATPNLGFGVTVIPGITARYFSNYLGSFFGTPGTFTDVQIIGTSSISSTHNAPVLTNSISAAATVIDGANIQIALEPNQIHTWSNADAVTPSTWQSVAGPASVYKIRFLETFKMFVICSTDLLLVSFDGRNEWINKALYSAGAIKDIACSENGKCIAVSDNSAWIAPEL